MGTKKATKKATTPKGKKGDAPTAQVTVAVPKKEKKVSALDAAAKVLADAGKPMTCPELITAMAEKGLWSSPKGKTPASTLYAAMLREINVKGKDARFKKVDRGQFAANK